MEQLKARVKDLENGRASDMDYLEHENEDLKDKVNDLTEETETLRKQLANLQAQVTSQPVPAPRAPSKSSDVTGLTTEVAGIKGRLKLVETDIATKQSTVFGARLNTNEDLTDNTWKRINRCDQMYTLSPCFQQNNCMFKAPIKGDYHMDMGVRQQGDGGLEVAFNGKGTSSFKHSYVGNTRGDSQVCHKTVIVSLDAGDLVYGIVRRRSGQATINWCSFHGCLIAGDVTATTASPAGATNTN